MWVFSRPWNLLRLFICKHSARSPLSNSTAESGPYRTADPCHSATITASVRGGRSFISGASLSVSQPNQPRLPYSVQLSFLFLRFLLHSTRQSTSFSVWHWLCFISAEQNVQSVHSCNCVIDDKAHKKNLTRNLFTYLDFIDNGLTTSTHTLSVLSK